MSPTIVKGPQLISGPPEVLVPAVDQQTVLERVRRVPPAAAGPRAGSRRPRAPPRAGPAPLDGARAARLARQLAPELGL